MGTAIFTSGTAGGSCTGTATDSGSAAEEQRYKWTGPASLNSSLAFSLPLPQRPAYNTPVTTATDWPSNVLARRDGAGIFVRPDPVRGQWSFADLFTAEGHHVLATVSVAIRCGVSSADQQMLSERWLGTQRTVSLDDIQKCLLPIFRALLLERISTQSAEQLRKGQDQLQKDLFVAGNRDAFAGGYELLAPMALSLELPTFDQQRLSHALEQQSAARLERLTSTIDAISSGQVDRLRALSPQEATGVHEQLLHRAASASKVDLIIPAGHVLLRTSETDTTNFPLPTDLGPLRSVNQLGEDRILVGAQRGLFELDAVTLHPLRQYGLPSTTSSRGINSAARSGDTLYATHSELGLLAWTAPDPSGVIIPCPDARQLIVEDRDVYVITTQGVHVLETGTLRPIFTAPAPILHAAMTKIGMILITEEGTIHRIDPHQDRELQTIARRTPLSAGHTTEIGGFVYSVLAPRQGPVYLMSHFDQALVEIPALSAAPRLLSMNHGRIAALSNDRCRVELFSPLDRVVRSIPVLSLTAHRGTDLLMLD